MIELTKEQRIALESGPDPLRAVDPETHAEYVLVPAGVYDQLKAAFADGEGWVRDAFPAAIEVFARDGWDDPRMDVYDSLDPRENP